MQVLASLDRDKNTSITIALVFFLCCDEKRARSDLWSDFVLLQRSPIELASEETYGRTCFIFFDDQLDLPMKETDRLY